MRGLVIIIVPHKPRCIFYTIHFCSISQSQRIAFTKKVHQYVKKNIQNNYQTITNNKKTYKNTSQYKQNSNKLNMTDRKQVYRGEIAVFTSLQ